jgi:hypothetical protein
LPFVEIKKAGWIIRRLPGKCYDDFINEIIEFWGRYRAYSSLCSPGKACIAGGGIDTGRGV